LEDGVDELDTINLGFCGFDKDATVTVGAEWTLSEHQLGQLVDQSSDTGNTAEKGRNLGDESVDLITGGHFSELKNNEELQNLWLFGWSLIYNFDHLKLIVFLRKKFTNSILRHGGWAIRFCKFLAPVKIYPKHILVLK
jgi:hypothetical protein